MSVKDESLYGFITSTLAMWKEQYDNSLYVIIVDGIETQISVSGVLGLLNTNYPALFIPMVLTPDIVGASDSQVNAIYKLLGKTETTSKGRSVSRTPVVFIQERLVGFPDLQNVLQNLGAIQHPISIPKLIIDESIGVSCTGNIR